MAEKKQMIEPKDKIFILKCDKDFTLCGKTLSKDSIFLVSAEGFSSTTIKVELSNGSFFIYGKLKEVAKDAILFNGQEWVSLLGNKINNKNEDSWDLDI